MTKLWFKISSISWLKVARPKNALCWWINCSIWQMWSERPCDRDSEEREADKREAGVERASRQQLQLHAVEHSTSLPWFPDSWARWFLDFQEKRWLLLREWRAPSSATSCYQILLCLGSTFLPLPFLHQTSLLITKDISASAEF